MPAESLKYLVSVLSAYEFDGPGLNCHDDLRSSTQHTQLLNARRNTADYVRIINAAGPSDAGNQVA